MSNAVEWMVAVVDVEMKVVIGDVVEVGVGAAAAVDEIAGDAAIVRKVRVAITVV